jgi:hypothetical protein
MLSSWWACPRGLLPKMWGLLWSSAPWHRSCVRDLPFAYVPLPPSRSSAAKFEPSLSTFLGRWRALQGRSRQVAGPQLPDAHQGALPRSFPRFLSLHMLLCSFSSTRRGLTCSSCSPSTTLEEERQQLLSRPEKALVQLEVVQQGPECRSWRTTYSSAAAWNCSGGAGA